MKKRKLLLFPFTAVLVLGLTACEHSNIEASPTQTVPAAEKVSSPKCCIPKSREIFIPTSMFRKIMTEARHMRYLSLSPVMKGFIFRE